MSYEGLTDEIFDRMPARVLLAIPSIYEILREEFNDDILTRYEADYGDDSEDASL